MSRSVKAIIAGVIITVGGLVVFLCAMGASGWNLYRANNWQEGTTDFSTPVTKLNIKVDAGQVKIRRVNSEQIIITYDFNEVYQPEIFMREDGALNITTGHRRWYEFGSWYGDAPKMQINIPESWYPNLDLTMNAGTLDIDDGIWGVYTSIKVNAGVVNVGDIKTGDLEIKLNAGKLDTGKITCEKVFCKLNAGTFDVEEVICKEFTCKLNAGNADVGRLDSISTSLNLSAGSVTVHLVGEQSDYNISVDKSAGSCNVSGNTSSTATRTLTVDLSAGSANVRFVG